MSPIRTVAFLPGAVGDGEFWRPVASRLPDGWRKLLHSWPGLGTEPHDATVQGFDDLVARVKATLRAESDLVAQSMGAIVAVQIAALHPRSVRRLVLVATSGGMGEVHNQGADWRQEYRAEYPDAATWITEPQPDHAELLELITAPTLLVWGDSDPISPISVGERLAERLPNATLRVIPGGTHSLAHDHAERVAALIADHLADGE